MASQKTEPSAAADRRGTRHAVQDKACLCSASIPAGNVTLPGELEVPAGAVGIVLFVHGSGSSRHSPRNQFVARTIREAGTATLLFDLLTREEEAADALEDLIVNARTQHILLSYNDEGVLSLEEIQRILSLRGEPKF